MSIVTISSALGSSGEAIGRALADELTYTFADREIILKAAERLGQGVAWRNSDLTMCSRVRRASEECGCRYDAISSSLDGFGLGGWSGPVPPGCRKAKVDGADYDHIVICEITQGEIGDIELNLDFSENLQGFCRENFRSVLPVRAPTRTLQKAGSCAEKATPFCAAHSGSSP